MEVDEINIKLLILGHGGVGKTSIISNYLGKSFPDRYIPTIGSSIFRKEFNLNDKKFFIRVNIWDVGGQRSFNPINPACYTNMDAAFLVFDLSQPKETLLEVKQEYIKNLHEYAEDSLTFVCGNKLDLITNRKELKHIVEDNFTEDVPLLFISAKTSENIQEIFELMIYSFLKELERKYPEEKKIEGITKEFLKTVDKSEKDLVSLFINSANIDSLKLLKKSSPRITKKKLTPTFDATNDDELQRYFLLRQELKKIDLIKGEIIENFNKNINEVEKLINNLKETPINSLIETIENTSEQLANIKDDFEVSLDALLNLEQKVDTKRKIKKEESLENLP